MSSKKEKWNPPSWPWELELITLIFVLAALLIPFYFNQQASSAATAAAVRPLAVNGASPGHSLLSTQIGFLWAALVVALYVLHIAFSAIEVNRVTASPHHLLGPCIFAIIAYYRIDAVPNLQNTELNMIDGSVTQVAALLVSVALVTSILARLRTARYLSRFDDVQWDITSRALYDSSYANLLMQLRPLLYAPRRYRACTSGILVEGWFYAMPLGFTDIHGLSIVNSANSLNAGNYYASSSHHLVRVELHDSLKPTFISPENREEFVRYCIQFIARRKASHRASPTRHGMMHASDTSAATTTHDGSASATKHANG